MKAIFHALLSQPLWNALIFIYGTIAFRDLGIAIILLTVVVRLALFPLAHKGMRQQAVLTKIKPHIDELGRKYKTEKERHAKELMALYRTHGVNPVWSIVVVLIQLPVLIALYRIFLNGLQGALGIARYAFVPDPGTISATFVGLLNLHEPSIVLVVAAAALQYVQGRQMPQGMNKALVWIGPIITFIILMRLPSAIALYWTTSTVFSIVQQLFITRALARETFHGSAQNDHKKIT